MSENFDKKDQQAFSLLEVVITLAILVTVIFAISNLMRNTFDVKVALSQKNKVTNRVNRAMQKISYDLGHAFLLHPRWQVHRTDGVSRTHFSIKKNSKGDRLAMTYMGHEAIKANSPESDLSYLVYELRPSPKFPHRKDLYRGELLRIPEKDFRFKDDPPMRAFVKNIESLEILPWNGDDWSKSGWDSGRGDTGKILPHMVMVKITAWIDDPIEGIEPDESEESLVHYSTIVYLPYALDFKELKSRNSSFNWKL